jgi:hypothetical protein
MPFWAFSDPNASKMAYHRFGKKFANPVKPTKLYSRL